MNFPWPGCLSLFSLPHQCSCLFLINIAFDSATRAFSMALQERRGLGGCSSVVEIFACRVEGSQFDRGTNKTLKEIRNEGARP